MRSGQTILRDARGVFRRHWWLLVIPIPLALLITIWVVAATPTLYQSQMAIWSEGTTAQAPQTALTANGQTPAGTEQSLLDELLSTDTFRQAVATAGPLAGWLSAHPASRLTPSGMTGLLHASSGLSDRIRSALLSGTSTTVQGPQVLSIGFKAQSPSVARGTLTAMLTAFLAQRTALVPAADLASLRILDTPSTPAGPTSGTTKPMATVIYGLVAGVIVTILAVVVLTLAGESTRRSARRLAPGADPQPRVSLGRMPGTGARAPIAGSATAHPRGRPDRPALRPRGSHP
jgi:hypothetical protein